MAVEKRNRIFVNRSLNMNYIRAIGFDMDHTLARYYHETFEELAFTKTIEKLVENGYPQAILNLKFDSKLCIRGLLIDKKRGNLLKVDGHKYVKLAYHGKTKMEKSERHSLYNVDSYKAETFLSVDTFFSLSEVQLFAELIDFKDKHPGSLKQSYEQIYQDIRNYIDLCHRDGSIKTEVMRHPSRFIERDPHLAEALFRLLEGDKTLFLLTNSLYDYTEVILSYLLDDAHPDLKSWKQFFNFKITGSGKPGFFTGSQPFYEVTGQENLLREISGPLESSKIYQGGSASRFQTLTGFQGDEIMYVGDHIYTDIIRSKGLFNWRTMLVVEELERELDGLRKQKAGEKEILSLIDQLEEMDIQLAKARMRIRNAEKKILEGASASIQKEHEQALAKYNELKEAANQCDRLIAAKVKTRDDEVHPYWGQLMRVGWEKSRFAQQLEQYACIYSARVSNLRFYSPAKRFISAYDQMPHEIS